MRYSVALKPGNVAKDVGLGIQMTRRPVVAAVVAAAAAVSVSSEIFLDTYSANGALADHIADSGQGYSDGPAFLGGGIGGLTLDLESGLSAGGGGAVLGRASIGLAQDWKNGYLRVLCVSSGSSAATGANFVIGFRYSAAGPDGWYLKVFPANLTEGNNLKMEVHSVIGGADTNASGVLDTFEAPDGAFTTFAVRILFIDDTLRIFLRDIEFFSQDLSALPAAAGGIFVAIDEGAGESFVFLLTLPEIDGGQLV